MEFFAAKCPNCSGELMLPDNMSQVICMYCGNSILVKKPDRESGDNSENLLSLAVNAFNAKNYEESYSYFTRTLEYDSDNFVAHIGKAESALRLSEFGKSRVDEFISGLSMAVDKAQVSEKAIVAEKAVKAIIDSCIYLDYFDQIKCLEFASEIQERNVEIILLSIKAIDKYTNFCISNLKDSSKSFWPKIIKELDLYNSKRNGLISKLSNIAPEKINALHERDFVLNKLNLVLSNRGYSRTA